MVRVAPKPFVKRMLQSLVKRTHHGVMSCTDSTDFGREPLVPSALLVRFVDSFVVIARLCPDSLVSY